jgi:hypothetical protein
VVIQGDKMQIDDVGFHVVVEFNTALKQSEKETRQFAYLIVG